METVEIPLQIAQKAMRHFRPLIPYVRKRLAELRREKSAIVKEINSGEAIDIIQNMEGLEEAPVIVKPKKEKKKVKK